MVKKGTAIVIGIAAFFGGLALGMLIAPLKGGIGNNSGNTTNNYFGPEDDDEYDDEEDDDDTEE